jgi:hypothetical protein
VALQNISKKVYLSVLENQLYFLKYWPVKTIAPVLCTSAATSRAVEGAGSMPAKDKKYCLFFTR